MQGRIQEFQKRLLDSFEANFFSPNPPPPLPPVVVVRYNSLAAYRLIYLYSTRKGYTLAISSSCVWLQKLKRFRQHQYQDRDVGA